VTDVWNEAGNSRRLGLTGCCGRVANVCYTLRQHFAAIILIAVEQTLQAFNSSLTPPRSRYVPCWT